MEHHLELKRHSRDQKSFGASAKTTLSPTGQRIDLQDRFKQEKPYLSYADLHHEITRSGKDVSPKSSINPQKQRIVRKGNKKEDLVKYMSKLPNYLEKGKNPQEKVLNVGVLDWGRLEKWQCSHKQMPHSGGRSSLSSSSLSSSFSTDAFASESSRGYISSPPHQRIGCPSLQFHPMSSPIEAQACPQVVKLFRQNVKFQYPKEAQHFFNNRDNSIKTEKPFGEAHQESKPEEFKGKDSDSKIGRESRTLPNGVKYEVASSMKVKLKTRNDQYVKRVEKQQEGNPVVVDHAVPGKQETVLLLPTDLPQNKFSRASNLSGLNKTLGQRPAETRRRSFLQRSKGADLPCEVDNNHHFQTRQTGFIDAEIENSSERSQSVPRSAKIGNCPSGGGILENRKSTTTINKPTINEPPMGSDLKVSKVSAEEVRSTSPFRRLSFSMNKIGKGSGSKEASDLPQLNTTYVSAQSCSKNAVASSGLDTSTSDKGNTTSRARLSPLRRLLDPILKSRPTNCHNNSEPLPRDSISKDRVSKGVGLPYSSNVAAQSGKVKLNMTSCRSINVTESLKEKKHGSQAVQALLRVAFKNGQPLFTFAVDKESDILAATLKKLSASRKEDYSSLYTFLTIQEVKKNRRWLNQGGKGQIHDYIPNAVAQMKVRGSCSSNLIKENYVDQFSMREFVLSSVELRQADEQTSDLQPNDELAAIVVKIPTRINRSSLIHGYQSDMLRDHPEVGLKDYWPEVMYDCNPGTNIQNCPSIISRDIGATVILPSGVHALPNKGEPASLIQRWGSGGSCDCGGWDLGCKLRILANQSQLIRKAGSFKACSTSNQFELFYQGGVQDKQPFFSLAPFKDGLYSVEFNSSLSLLQAFSICIAILDSRKACEFSESSNLFEEKSSAETVSVQIDGKRAPERTEGVVPARYASCPPLSPVGRV